METRFLLACEMIKNAIRAGHNVLIVDGSPNAYIREAFKELGANVTQQLSKGMGPSRRELFRDASDAYETPVYLWMEPEKVDLIRFIPQIVGPIFDGAADIVIPTRTNESFASYPDFQVASEQRSNDIFRVATGHDLDVLFGPVALSSGLLSLFEETDPFQMFGMPDGYIQQPAVMRAMAAGWKVTGVPVAFRYPEALRDDEMKADEEFRKKRDQQNADLSKAFITIAHQLELKAA